MHSKLHLLILAGGLGSRYKGSKQLDTFGTQRACLLEFAMYDAVLAGFERIIIVVNQAVLAPMREQLKSWEDRVELVFVIQELKTLAQDQVSRERFKPWGTAQAVISARTQITGPFVVMNADDYYGSSVLQQAADFFHQEQHRHGLIAYTLEHTLSLNGGVSRGVCQVDSNGTLVSVEERHQLQREDDTILAEHGISFQPDTLVSMNFWLFQRTILDELERYFEDFFAKNKDSLTAECYLPSAVQVGIETMRWEVCVLKSSEKWVGLTFPADRPLVEAYLQDLSNAGKYPKSFGHE